MAQKRLDTKCVFVVLNIEYILYHYLITSCILTIYSQHGKTPKRKFNLHFYGIFYPLCASVRIHSFC